MADIGVERKGARIWPWILGLLVLALLVWLLVGMFDEDPVDVAEDPAVAPIVAPQPQQATIPAPVEAYLAQCTASAEPEPADMGVEHQFTVGCLEQLRDGMDALVTGGQVANTDVTARLDEYSTTVQQLAESDTTQVTHANLTRDAATTAAEVMEAMQTAWFTGVQPVTAAVEQTRGAAEGIQGEVQLLEQRDAVRTFFRTAGDALRTMAESGATAAPL